MHRLAFGILIICFLASVASCGGPKKMKNFRDADFPDVGVSISVPEGWIMTVWDSDFRSFHHRLRSQPEYLFPPITAVKDDMDPDEETYMHKPNWRFIGVKGKFDATMSPMSSEYPVPEGLYFVGSIKGILLDDRTKPLKNQGLEGIDCVVRSYEETHGTGAYTDLWHAYTITFNYKGNAYEFIMRIPSEADRADWMEFLDEAVSGLTLVE